MEESKIDQLYNKEFQLFTDILNRSKKIKKFIDTSNKINSESIAKRIESYLNYRAEVIDDIKECENQLPDEVQLKDRYPEVKGMIGKILAIDNKFLNILKEINKKYTKEMTKITENNKRNEGNNSNFVDIRH